MKDTSVRSLPNIAIPDPIVSDVPGTWAYSTVTARLPEIARRTLPENDFSSESERRIAALIADIPSAPVRLLQQAAQDARDWETYTRPFLGQHWLEAPWFFIETYFYRRLLEATGYFEAGPGQNRDPFIFQKEKGLNTSRKTIATLAEHLSTWHAGDDHKSHLTALLAIDLWGNRADLSLWPADEGQQPSHEEWETFDEQLLVDDTNEVVELLANRSGTRIDFLVDNAGLELVIDLALADYLLSSGIAASVYLHMKTHPTFVSDAMKKDVRSTINWLSSSDDPATAAFGRRLANEAAGSSLILQDHPFWTSPLAFWEMPQDLRQELAQADLIISKGDANYRRLLGDRCWPYTASFQDIMAYTPAPLLALRTLKAELAAGLKQDQIERLNQDDPQWLINGRWGVIQFAPGNHTR